MTDRQITVIYPDPKTLPPNLGDVQLVDGVPQGVSYIYDPVPFEEFAARMQGLDVVDTMVQYPDSGSVTLEGTDVQRWIDTKP